MAVRQGAPGEIKKGSFIIIDSHPCKCVNVDSSAPGKHGHRKYRIDAISLFDGSKHALLCPSHSKIEIPIVDKRQAQVLSVEDSKIQVMDLETYETFDLEVPEDKKGTIEPNSQVFYWEVLDRKILPSM